MSKHEKEVSESGSQIIGKALKQIAEQSGPFELSNKHDDIPAVDCGAALLMHDKSSQVSIQPQSLGACLQTQDSTLDDLKNTGILNDTEDIAENAVKSCPLAHVKVVEDQNIICSVGSEGEALRLSCKVSQKGNLFLAKDPLGPHTCKPENTVSVNAVERGNPDSKEQRLRAFLFMESCADSHATIKVQASAVQETEARGAFVTSKRGSKGDLMKPSKRQHFLTEDPLPAAKQQRFWAFKQRRGYKQPPYHLTSLDIERLVMAVEKFGIGRWRDIKETYFSVDSHLSAANLKDKWRSLLHSVKLPAAKQRSVKLSSALVSRILELDERDKLLCIRRLECSAGLS